MSFPSTLHAPLICLAALFHLTALGESPLPEFVTHELKEINATMTKPKEWHVTVIPPKKEEEPLAYQITLEDAKTLGGFKTGMTINVYEKVPQRYSLKPTEFAAMLMKRYAAKGEVLTFKEGIQAGPMEAARLRLRKTMPILGKDTETMLSVTTIANNQTGTCYFVIFGTPAELWAEHEKILIEMSKITLDDER